MMAFPLFGSIPIAPETFAGWPTYQKHEAVLMLRECGLKKTALCDVLQLSPKDLSTITADTRLHCPPGDADVVNEQSVGRREIAPDVLSPRRASGKMMLWMATLPEGKAGLDFAAMETQSGVKPGGGCYAMNKLFDFGYVAHVRKATNRAPGVWQITPFGWKAHAALMSKMAEVD